ncbi:unnamed protein product [Parnassius mnemosyne]|uniref:MHC class I antigen n=1 Tax=Parnassius mnemosyne TaxID=213953 RepID=A0AAV1K8P4_9NEOP
MATVFWDSEGILLIDYVPRGSTMNGQYYANLLTQVRESYCTETTWATDALSARSHRTCCEASPERHGVFRD